MEADHLALHLGRVHHDALAPEEEAAFQAALDRERAWVATVRRHARGILFALPIAALYGALVLLSVLMDGNPAFTVMPLPFVAILSGLVYYLAYTHDQGDAPAG